MEPNKNNVRPVIYNKDFQVTQANELVRSRQDDLTLLETRLIRLAISQVLKKDSDLQTYSCSVAKLAEYLCISKENIYRDIQNLAQNLMKKSIFIVDQSSASKPNRPNYKILHWIDYVEYIDGTITFKLSEGLKPYLLELGKVFTTYSYDVAISLNTNHAIRFYEALVSFENIAINGKQPNTFEGITLEAREVAFSITWLREFFNCQEKYSNTNRFLEQVISKSIDAINEKTFMRVSYHPIRKGRSIIGIAVKYEEWTDEDVKRFLQQ